MKLQIDDPLDAFAVHGACGAWGCIAVGLFCSSDYTYNLKGHDGLFYGGGTLFGVQILGVLTEICWVAGTSSVLFFTLSMLGLLRVSEEEEDRGLDLSEHEGPAYMIERTTGGPPRKKNSTNKNCTVAPSNGAV